MQYYAKPVDEDFEVLKKSLNNFLSSVDFVGEIRLIGGEPLLYKKIGDVMELILQYNNYNKIYVYTNGTIVFKNNKMNVFQNEKDLAHATSEISEIRRGGGAPPPRLART